MPAKKKSESTPKAGSKAKKAAPKSLEKKIPKAPKAVKVPKAKAPKAPKAVKEPKAPAAQKAPAQLKPARPRAVANPVPPGRLPRMGETRMVAFVRDPLCVFTYWEVTPESLDKVKRELMDEYKGSSMVLRVFRNGPDGQVELLQEIQVKPGEMNRYLALPETGGAYFVEIAQKTKSGRVAVYARSNWVGTGSFGSLFSGAAGTGDSRWGEPSEGMRKYFSEEWGQEGTANPARGLSSAESQRKSKYAASHTGS